jgi:hypothetical protein
MRKTERLNSTKERRKIFRHVNQELKGYVPRIKYCRIAHGNIASEEQDVLRRWKEHFEEILGEVEVDNMKGEIDIHVS